ncbi:concanavalin A-like lectin/glucanase [Aspergillus affinis]|uniref:concanavalin A-like lectin/glucanase n=1 Tax=Aspergillus affinis TaxID=1070780 RepID=UPI0022FE5501|nr:concanavalin A-like lectin/glucanase [Aspergillus affinis]KAI9045882.1 concanavalin A-like lectin/glucanase [Aspergillus affinis]
MKLTSLLTTLTLAQGILGAPRSGLRERIAARSAQRAQTRQSQPMLELAPDREHRTSANIAYSANWAGVVRESSPTQGSSYTSVSATFTVPEPAPASNSPGGIQAASAWVGIDGDTYTTAILQAGVDFYYDNGQIYNDAWYEWFPDVAHDFDFAVSTGDVVSVTVESYTPTDGVAVIVNESTGQRATQQISAPSGEKLAGENADWIVEDFQSGSEMVPLVDFGTVQFMDMQAEAGGRVYGTDGATVIEMKQNGKVVTSVQTLGDDVMRMMFTPRLLILLVTIPVLTLLEVQHLHLLTSPSSISSWIPEVLRLSSWHRPRVHITQGTLLGSTIAENLNVPVEAFRGIPCPGKQLIPLKGDTGSDEDYLTMNVFRPKGVNGKDKVPVAAQFRQFVSASHCDNLPDNKIFPCLRNKPIDLISNASFAVFDCYNPSVRWAFQPVIDNELIKRRPIDAWHSGVWNKMPILTGFNANEGTYYVPVNMSTLQEFRNFFHTLLPAYTEKDLDTIDTLYPDPATTPASSSPEYGNENPVFLYRWALNKTVQGGANHADQLPYEAFDVDVRGLSDAQEEVAGQLHAYVTSFIVAGDPNSVPGRYPDRPRWERYVGEEGEWRVMVFGEGNDERAGGTGVGAAAKVVDDAWSRRECEFWWTKAGISD